MVKEIKEFVIPINKDDLLTSYATKYCVEDITPLRMITQSLDETRESLNKNGAYFILDHFDKFFSVVSHSNKVELPVVQRSIGRIIKAVELLVIDLEKVFDHKQELEEQSKSKILCTNKMLAYLLSWHMLHIEDRLQAESNDFLNAKGKRNAKKSDFEEQWEDIRCKALEIIFQWLQLPLHQLWNPPIIEEAFITCFSQICYKILERATDAKLKIVRQSVFEILVVLIKKYNYGTICVVRLVQLVKMCEPLAAHLGVGVVYMAKNCGCKGLIKEIVKEIAQIEPGEADGRNISIFLESIASADANLLLPLLDNIIDHLTNEFYMMRNGAIGVLEILIKQVLTGEDLTEEQKEKRDECLNNLEDHISDCNAYVRSKTLQVWQHLCIEGAVPLARQGRLLATTTLRLEDKSASVRKQALQLLRALLQSNPYAAKLDRSEISKSLEEETIKLKELKTALASNSSRGDSERLDLWNSLLPDVRKAIKKVIEDMEEEENEEEIENDENIDPNFAFEHIRQLMLEEKVIIAVTYLYKICTKLKDAPSMNGLDKDAKEECLFVFLLKIFMDSENVPETAIAENGEEAISKEVENPEQIEKRHQLEAKKRLVKYLRNSLEFAEELEKAISMVKYLLFSIMPGDAVEAVTFLGVAYQFGIKGAASSVHKAILLVFNRDQSVQKAVGDVYKDIYLNIHETNRTDRQKALSSARGLITLLKGLESGQSLALQQLITGWYKDQEIDNETLQVLWEKFSMKLPDTTEEESRAALILITMIAQSESGIITDNLDVLIKVGLGSRAKSNLLLARDTCRAFMNINQNCSDIEKQPIKYTNDHEIFKELYDLMVEHFFTSTNNEYLSFATHAINAIYHIANQPDHLMKRIIIEISEKGKFIKKEETLCVEDTVPSYLLSRLLYVIGHVAIRQMVHLDTNVYKEIKRRNVLRELKKGKRSKSISKDGGSVASTPSSAGQTLRNKEAIIEDNGEEALGAADDADAEFINSTLENEIVTGEGLLTKFLPLVLEICQHPEKFTDENLQASAAMALCKMMTVSSILCEQALQLLITILEKSPYPEIRSNVLIGLSDLTIRFPNQIEPWTKYIYARLRDNNDHVRTTCVRMLSNLIMREMIRVKGQVSELALCIVDNNQQIAQDTKQLFKDLARKGNALYNVMPDILSRLVDPSLELSEENFQKILKYILGLMQKEKQVDSIIDKICTRFKLANTELQWRNLSYCLSLLQFNSKSIRRLIESLPLLKEKIHNRQVLKALNNIIEQTKKKTEAKAACIELEEKMKELMEMNEDNELTLTDTQMMPPPTIRRKTVRRIRRKSSSEEDESEDDMYEDEPKENKSKNKNDLKTPRNLSKANSNLLDSDIDTPRRNPPRSSTRILKKKYDDISPDASPLQKKNKRNSTSPSDKIPVGAARKSARSTGTSARFTETPARSTRTSVKSNEIPERSSTTPARSTVTSARSTRTSKKLNSEDR
ncbi:condensin complex subunit 1 [Prorops nasuta]|uniref:condensin complex subunit 1 n=1 Tax=Prorops nasuta TaxID=863751 RepID=UPI0034D01AEB